MPSLNIETLRRIAAVCSRLGDLEAIVDDLSGVDLVAINRFADTTLTRIETMGIDKYVDQATAAVERARPRWRVVPVDHPLGDACEILVEDVDSLETQNARLALREILLRDVGIEAVDDGRAG